MQGWGQLCPSYQQSNNVIGLRQVAGLNDMVKIKALNKDFDQLVCLQQAAQAITAAY